MFLHLYCLRYVVAFAHAWDIFEYQGLILITDQIFDKLANELNEI